jgi:mitotic spindle assembly checkpoint protein MAD1
MASTNNAVTATPVPASRLSVSKRKRDETTSDTPSTPSNAAALMQTPRLRSLPPALLTPSHGGNGLLPAVPSTPLLSIPTPSSELLPVLTARKNRAGLQEAASTSGSLLRSSSAVTPAANANTAAAAAAAAATYAASLRSLESAARERERALRVSVEELRAAVRAKTTDLAEAALKAEQREAAIQQERVKHAERVEKLQAQLRFIHGEERKESSKLQDVEQELTQAQQTQQQQRIELTKLKQQLVFASSPGQHKPSRQRAANASSSEDEEVDGQVKHLENLVALQARQIDDLKSQIDDLKQNSSDAADERREAEETRAQLEYTEAMLESARSEARANASLTATAEVTSRRAGEILSVQQKCEALEAQNLRLLASRTNSALAAEQLLSAQAKLHRLEAAREESAKVALENERLKVRLATWEDAMRSLGIDGGLKQEEKTDQQDTDDDVVMSDSAAPASLTEEDTPAAKRRRRQSAAALTPAPFLSSYHQLQSSNLQLQSQLHASELKRKTEERRREELETEKDSMDRRVRELTENLERIKSDFLNLQRQNVVLTKSRDGLQKVLDAYDNEQAPLLRAGAGSSSSSAMQVDSGDAAAAGGDASPDAHQALRTRVAYLESIIKEYEAQIDTIARESGRTRAANPHAASPIEPIPSVLSLLSRIVHLEKESSHLEGLLTDAMEKVEWVQRQYPHLLDKEHGNFKVVKLANNPSHAKVQSKQQAELDAVQKENQILKLRCDELQAGGTNTAVGGASASSLLELETAFQSRISALELEKSQMEKKQQRLKELFGQKVQEFRQTCFLLTGYKIELVQGSSYRLKNMYAEKEEDQLMFQQQPANTAASGAVTPGGMAVLETDFTKTLPEAITGYLEKFESIPGFLAAVTLDLLSKQTRKTTVV